METGEGVKREQERGRNEHTETELEREDRERGGGRGSQGLRGLLQHRGQRPASHPGLAHGPHKPPGSLTSC